MRLADAARSPQVQVVRGGIEILGSLIREFISRRDLKSFKGELPVRFLSAEKLNQFPSHRQGASRVLALTLQGGQAIRTDSSRKLGSPDAGPGECPAT